MNAKEANKLSAKVAAMNDAEAVRRAKKERLELIAKGKKERVEYAQGLARNFESSIKSAVEQGKKSTLVWMTTGDEDAQARERFEGHPYFDLIKKAMDELKKDGYTVETEIQSQEHWTYHESSVPDYSWYTSSLYIKISW